MPLTFLISLINIGLHNTELIVPQYNFTDSTIECCNICLLAILRQYKLLKCSDLVVLPLCTKYPSMSDDEHFKDYFLDHC